jgi:class 3 adenylate cyclase/tetratricopeptide (TPR) repeat protein
VGFLDTVRQAAALLHDGGRVSERALRREFDLDDQHLDDLIEELVEVRRVATRDGDVLVAVSRPGTSKAGAAPQEPSLRLAALQPGSADTDRRDLTVLFSDLVGSTELSTRLDSEDYGEAIRVYHEAATDVVTRCGGFVAQLQGDGLVVLFGYPEAQEDSADQAVRAALEIVRVVDDLGRGLSVRVGLHSGPCVIRIFGAGGRRDTVVLGETPNIAARVQAAAEPGEVMISAATHRLVAGWFVVEEAGARAMKGVPQPIVVHRVLRPSTVRSRLEARSTGGLAPLVGRDRERRLLFDRWDRAVRGEGQVVHICGEPGIGKSRLALVLHEHLAGQPHRWLAGSCTRYVRNTAFHPIVEMVEQLLGFEPGDQPADRVRRVEQGLRTAGLTTEEQLALITSFLALPHPSWGALSGLSPEARRQRTIDGLVAWLLALSERDPVVLLVEDLHWCDPSSLELLGRVVERIATEHVLLVTTSRPEIVPAWVTLDHVHNVSLDRVTEQEATDLVNAMLARSVVDDGVSQRIVERADGNPLFLEELSQMMLEASDHATTLDPAALDIPSTLQSSLLARLDRLGEAKAFAQVAGVIGREFSRKMLQLVIMDAQIGLDEDALDDALVQLTDTGLIVRASTRSDTYIFKHALVQDAASHSLLRAIRSHLHRSVVHVLRKNLPHRISAQPELAARHAEAGGMVDDAIAWYEQASEQARARSEHEEALLHLGRALDLLATEVESIERDQREIALQQTLAVELFVARGYSVPEAIAALERVRELAQSCDDTRSHAAAVIGLALAAYTSTDFERGETLVVEGLAIAERAGAVAHMVAALGTYALTVFFQGRFREGHEAAERAVTLYDPAQHHRELVAIVGDDTGVSALATSGWSLLHLGFPDQAMARCDEAVRLANSLDTPYSIAQALVWRLALLNDRRDETMADAATDARRYCDEQGFPAMSGGATAFLGLALNDLDVILEGTGVLASTGTLLMAPSACMWVADSYRAQGLYDDALAMIDAGLDLGVSTRQHYYDCPLHRVKAEVILTDDRQPEVVRGKAAEDEFRQATEIAQAQESKWFELRATIGLARLFLSEQRRNEARDCLQPIFSSFTEGFDTRDLRDARALLAEIGT